MHNYSPELEVYKLFNASNISFAKYQGNANDFIIFSKQSVQGLANFADFLPWCIKNAQKLCDRNLGIGADGIILLAEKEGILEAQVINADGSLAANCGNGLRCIARWFFDLSAKSEVLINLGGFLYEAELRAEHILVRMGECTIFNQAFEPKSAILKEVDQVFVASMGNEHLVFLLKQPLKHLDKLVADLKLELSNITQYNLGFSYLNQNGVVFSQVYERGVGFTKSCGTGAMAAVCAFALIDNSLQNRPIEVCQPGGSLLVSATKKSSKHFSLTQEGGAQRVYEGIFKTREFATI